MMIGKEKKKKMKRLGFRDFVKCHPMPSPDDKEGEYWWFKVTDRLKNDQGTNGMIIFSFVRFDTIKIMYENLTEKKSHH